MNRITHYIRKSLQHLYPPEEVRAIAMLICCDMLGIDAIDIYMGKDITLSEEQHSQLENILLRLQKHEPIQYVRGTAEFCGHSFKVAPGVLIPRPETSELTQFVLQECPSATHLLDIGTGSGCIAITLSKGLPKAAVDAWDISEKALAIARENNVRLGAKVSFRQIDILSHPCQDAGPYDVIVSNPPYVTQAERSEMAPNVLEWEPPTALFVPDHNPLLFYRRIARLGRHLLREGGRLYFEINRAYGPETAHMLKEEGYRHIRILQDLFKNDRIVTADR